MSLEDTYNLLYTYTNEYLDAILEGLDINSTDRVLAVAKSNVGIDSKLRLIPLLSSNFTLLLSFCLFNIPFLATSNTHTKPITTNTLENNIHNLFEN